jgi:hypothetical protein
MEVKFEEQWSGLNDRGEKYEKKLVIDKLLSFDTQGNFLDYEGRLGVV